jgi:hypothetical protein
MSLADDLQKLEQLRSTGALSEDEFKQAKAKLITPPSAPPPVIVPQVLPESSGESPFQVAMGVLIVVLLMIIVLAIFLRVFGHGHFFHRGP